VVVTDLGVYHFEADGEMRLDTLHPGVSLDDVRAAIDWEVRVSPTLSQTPPPSADELRLIREVLDPDGRYTR
jgi:glutaconate CoA-transferase, subunit B